MVPQSSAVLQFEHTLKLSYHQFLNITLTLILVSCTKPASTQMGYMNNMESMCNVGNK